VTETLAERMPLRGVPEHIRSDYGPESTAQALREWLATVSAKTLYIEPGSPWENGYNERFKGTLGEKCLNQELFYSLTEAQVIIEAWRRQYNRVRPHSSLGYPPRQRPTDPTSLPRSNLTHCTRVSMHLAQKSGQLKFWSAYVGPDADGHDGQYEISPGVKCLMFADRLP